MTEFAIYGGVDHRNTVGKVAPGLFAQEGRCWRMVYENVAGHGAHCPGAGGVGRAVEVHEGLDEGVECERHADELPRARRTLGG